MMKATVEVLCVLQGYLGMLGGSAVADVQWQWVELLESEFFVFRYFDG